MSTTPWADAAGAAMSLPFPFVMVGQLISGAMTTLSTKFMVMQKVEPGPGQLPTHFLHPFFLSVRLMVGPLICLIPYYLTRKDSESGKEVPKLAFSGLSMLDWTANIFMTTAFFFLHASQIQMSRGAGVVFTFMLRTWYLGERQYGYHVLGVCLVVLGLWLVGLSVFSNPMHKGAAHVSEEDDLSWPAKSTGIMLVISGQMFASSQRVYEEKILRQYTVPPLLLLGMQGLYGLFVSITFLVFANLLRMETTSVTLHQLQKSTALVITLIVSIFAVALLSFTGVTVTQRAGAVARATLDAARTIIIWIVELSLGWITFNEVQLIGFIVLASGTLIYNRILVLPLKMLDPPPEAAVLVVETDEETEGKKAVL